MPAASCCSKRIGTSFEAKKWLALDPCGFTSVFFSFSIHISAFVILLIKLVSPDDTVIIVMLFLLYVPLFIMSLANLCMAWTSNPGAVPMGARPIGWDHVEENNLDPARENEPDEMEANPNPRPLISRGIRRCAKCNNNFKPQRAHHDSVTGRCVVKLDHFCPWVGNAVGALNHKFFILFIFYTCLSCLSTLIILATKALLCDQDDNDDSCDSFYSIPIFYLLVVSLVFFVFTICMLLEQVGPLRDNKSKIARLKIKSGQASENEYNKVANNLNELFGGESPHFALHWLLPTPVTFPHGMKDTILGFEYDLAFGDDPYNETLKVDKCPIIPEKDVPVNFSKDRNHFYSKLMKEEEIISDTASESSLRSRIQ